MTAERRPPDARADSPKAARRRPYEPPQLEVVEIKLDEVMAIGCKSPGPTGGDCGCITSGS